MPVARKESEAGLNWNHKKLIFKIDLKGGRRILQAGKKLEGKCSFSLTLLKHSIDPEI